MNCVDCQSKHAALVFLVIAIRGCERRGGGGGRDKARAQAKAGRRYYSEDESDGDGAGSDFSAERAAEEGDFFVHPDNPFEDPFFAVRPPTGGSFAFPSPCCSSSVFYTLALQLQKTRGIF